MDVKQKALDMIEVLKNKNKLYRWQQIAAYSYIAICLFDFLIMPGLVYGIQLSSVSTVKDLLVDGDGALALELVKNLKDVQWAPVTLKEGAFFHISFGAILSTSTYKQEKLQLPEDKTDK